MPLDKACLLSGRVLVVLGIFLGVALMPSGRAEAVTITVGSLTYEITRTETTYNAFRTPLVTTPWWRNRSLAQDFAEAFLAAAPQGLNAFFGYNENFTTQLISAFQATGGGTGVSDSSSLQATRTLPWATATQVTAVPEINGSALARMGLVVLTLYLALLALRRGRWTKS